jgi:hypothetical protein
VAAAKFVAGRQTRYLKEQEVTLSFCPCRILALISIMYQNATKQTKQVARSIAIGIQNFWKVIETIVIQRKQVITKE